MIKKKRQTLLTQHSFNFCFACFNNTNLENIKNVCRTNAIENAKQKAIALTKPMGQTLGKAIYISDIEANPRGNFKEKLREFLSEVPLLLMHQNMSHPKLSLRK